MSTIAMLWTCVSNGKRQGEGEGGVQEPGELRRNTGQPFDSDTSTVAPKTTNVCFFYHCFANRSTATSWVSPAVRIEFSPHSYLVCTRPFRDRHVSERRGTGGVLLSTTVGPFQPFLSEKTDKKKNVCFDQRTSMCEYGFRMSAAYNSTDTC